MASSPLSLLLIRRCLPSPLLRLGFPWRRTLSTSPLPADAPDDNRPKPGSLSARLSFVFDQLDAIERDRHRDRAARDDALQRIRSWRQSPHPQQQQQDQEQDGIPTSGHPSAAGDERRGEESMGEVLRKEVELVHPWPEWIELMERLAGQSYFDTRRTDEDRVAQNVSIDLSGIRDEVGFDFSRDWITVRTACMNFGRDRFDILRSLSRKDIQVLVGHGCPSMDPKVVFSAKLLRKYVHLDEGDVCSSCSLRNTCSRGYILTRKEDEARTLDVMRVLLTFGFDHVNRMVENHALMKMKSVKTVVRKLLHEVVKLSSVPIDPNLPPPVIKKPPPKVKQPPPPPKKRVGRDDVEMKKGDWLCPKCDFMNFAKNTLCLQCDAKRPKRQLLPGEWECPRCNFLNYRRNMACFHCEHKRPPDEFMENQIQAKQPGQRTRLERGTRLSGVSDAWNFDFDENESDGADVAAFEFADPPKGGEDSSLDGMPHGGIARGFEDDIVETRRSPRTQERGRYFSEPEKRKETLHSPRTGFDDFDDEEDDIDSYELESNGNSTQEVSRRNFSEFEHSSDSEEVRDFGGHFSSSRVAKNNMSLSEDDEYNHASEKELTDHPRWQSSHVADSSQRVRGRGGINTHRGMPFASDDDAELNSDSDEDLDAVFGSRERTDQQSLDRNRIKRGRNFAIDDGLLLDSDSGDDEGIHSGGIGMRRNKDVTDRRSNTVRNSNWDNSSRSRELRLNKRNRKKSFDTDVDELSSRGSRRYDRGLHREGSGRGSVRYDRGSHQEGSGGFRRNDKFQEFDHRQSRRTRTNEFNDRFRGPQMNDRGSRKKDYGGW